jgi:apolipoprotein N-acyltransferase
MPYQQSRTPFVSNISLALFSGLLLVFAFPDWGLWSLGWVGVAPLIMAIAREGRFWRSFILGTVTGTVFYIGTSHWITYSMHNYGEVPLWLSYCLMILICFLVGVFTGLFAGVLGLAINRFGGWAILTAPVIWATTEWLRLTVGGMGWNALGYSQAFQPAVIQIARWGGVYMVSALLVAVSAALVFATIYLERRRGFVVLTVIGLLATAAVIYGQSFRPEEDEQETVSLAVIQPNVPVAGDWDDPQFVKKLLDMHIELSEQTIQQASKDALNGKKNDDSLHHMARPDKVAGNRAVDLVVWPESSMNFDYERDAELRRQLADFTRRNNVYLLFNGWGFSGTSDNRKIYNSAMLIAPSGERVSRYDKIALMPFGEYVPARGWLPFMDRIPALVGDITPGNAITLMDIAGARLGAPICFDAAVPSLISRMRSEGASSLIQLSNEAWFGPSAVARQMLAQAVFRAVENDVEFIRSTNTGASARIDRYGLVYDETKQFETETRLWKIKKSNSSEDFTFYTRHGDVFVIACAVASMLTLVAAVVYGIILKNRQKLE